MMQHMASNSNKISSIVNPIYKRLTSHQGNRRSRHTKHFSISIVIVFIINDKHVAIWINIFQMHECDYNVMSDATSYGEHVLVLWQISIDEQYVNISNKVLCNVGALAEHIYLSKKKVNYCMSSTCLISYTMTKWRVNSIHGNKPSRT